MSEDTGGEAQVHTPPNPVEDPTDLPQLTRQSLRLRTPISRPGFIAPLSDSRRGLTSSTIPKPFRKKTAHAPVPERLEEIEQIHSEAESEEEIEISRKKVTKGASKKAPSGLKQQSKRTGKQVNVNLSQDSEENNNQVAPCPKNDKSKDRDGFDHCRRYFYPPGEGPKQKPGDKSYACRWCPNKFKATGQSYYDLKAHRRADAIKSGHSLPPSSAELVSAEAKSNPNSTGTLIAYTTKGRFSNTTLNKLLVIWIIQHSLPWLRLKDFLLRVCFDFSCLNSQLHSRLWAASQAHQLYLEQRTQVLKSIMASESKILLVSDVWTTRGSHKTTDLGSNNFTMAKAVLAKFRAFDATRWDVASNHYQCIFHVIALILGAGLKALKLLGAMVRPEKSDEYFPMLDTIVEVQEEEEVVEETDEIIEIVNNDNDISEDETVDPDDAEEELPEPGWERNEEPDPNNHYYICRRIASLPQKQAEWKLWAAKLGYSGRGVIGGYGIRWNIAYDSRQRAYEGRRVIKQLYLDNKTDQYSGKSASNHFFKSYELTTQEWADVNSLNNVLKAPIINGILRLF
ncbi:hypothetical protein PTTG_28765 [Puccinia triticina 1-1 BBBD Race 1]|uniref:BED-type domain-containing protein n=1 Tax=Puccinia triticina (isolate 1-1 / race 1 (BBBD)) TaxID=630390 RepID=A0A180G9M7_PUCT1|nr:hypothetical protein PTTG_28765 [Puccinia triticina 1-1 BBBD Race 1]